MFSTSWLFVCGIASRWIRVLGLGMGLMMVQVVHALDVPRDLIEDYISRFPASFRQAELAKDPESLEGDRVVNLLAFPLDVTGDGKAEIFIGSTEKQDRSVDWQAYQLPITPGGVFFALGEVARLPADGFYIQRGPGMTTLSAYQRLGRGEEYARYVLDRYHYRDDGTMKAESTVPEGRHELYLRRALSPPGFDLGRLIRPAIVVVRLQDVLAGSPFSWQPYDFDFAPHSQLRYRSSQDQTITLEELQSGAVAAASDYSRGKITSSASSSALAKSPDLQQSADFPRGLGLLLIVAGLLIALVGAYIFLRKRV